MSDPIETPLPDSEVPCSPASGGNRSDHHRTDAHSHSHSHSHASSSRSRLAAALAVTFVILVAEFVGAMVSGSLALAADAGHMLVDSSGLVVALIAAHLMTKPRTDRYTWGLARAEVIAAAVQAGMLLVICVVVAWQGVTRLGNPPDIETGPMLVIGVIGLIANVVSLVILSGGRRSSLNMKAAFLEVANDALGSVAVIIAAIVAYATGWTGADAIASLFIAALMAPRALKLLRTALAVLMEQTPTELDLDEVRRHMLGLTNVVDVHDLHVSTINTGTHALTAHVCTQAGLSDSERATLLHALEDCASEHFPISLTHTTFQFDTAAHERHERLNH